MGNALYSKNMKEASTWFIRDAFTGVSDSGEVVRRTRTVIHMWMTSLRAQVARSSGGRATQSSRLHATATVSFTNKQRHHNRIRQYARLCSHSRLAGICHLGGPLSAADSHHTCREPLCAFIYDPRNPPIERRTTRRLPDAIQHLQLQQC